MKTQYYFQKLCEQTRRKLFDCVFYETYYHRIEYDDNNNDNEDYHVPDSVRITSMEIMKLMTMTTRMVTMTMMIII